MLTEEEAIERLSFMTAAMSEPALDEEDITELLAECRQFEFWSAVTAYAVGDVLQPSIANGHRYVCITSGTSTATEPTWPEFSDGEVNDGTVEFQEIGPAYPEQWDLRRATHLGWLRKAAKVAADYTFSVDGQSFSRSHQHEHCIAMAAKFQPVTIA